MVEYGTVSARTQWIAALMRTRAERLRAAGLGQPEKLPTEAIVRNGLASYPCSNFAFTKGERIPTTHTDYLKEKKSA